MNKQQTLTMRKELLDIMILGDMRNIEDIKKNGVINFDMNDFAKSGIDTEEKLLAYFNNNLQTNLQDMLETRKALGI